MHKAHIEEGRHPICQFDDMWFFKKSNIPLPHELVMAYPQTVEKAKWYAAPIPVRVYVLEGNVLIMKDDSRERFTHLFNTAEKMFKLRMVPIEKTEFSDSACSFTAIFKFKTSHDACEAVLWLIGHPEIQLQDSVDIGDVMVATVYYFTLRHPSLF